MWLNRSQQSNPSLGDWTGQHTPTNWDGHFILLNMGMAWQYKMNQARISFNFSSGALAGELEKTWNKEKPIMWFTVSFDDTLVFHVNRSVLLIFKKQKKAIFPPHTNPHYNPDPSLNTNPLCNLNSPCNANPSYNTYPLCVTSTLPLILFVNSAHFPFVTQALAITLTLFATSILSLTHFETPTVALMLTHFMTPTLALTLSLFVAPT